MAFTLRHVIAIVDGQEVYCDSVTEHNGSILATYKKQVKRARHNGSMGRFSDVIRNNSTKDGPLGEPKLFDVIITVSAIAESYKVI